MDGYLSIRLLREALISKANLELEFQKLGESKLKPIELFQEDTRAGVLLVYKIHFEKFN